MIMSYNTYSGYRSHLQCKLWELDRRRRNCSHALHNTRRHSHKDWCYNKGPLLDLKKTVSYKFECVLFQIL